MRATGNKTIRLHLLLLCLPALAPFSAAAATVGAERPSVGPPPPLPSPMSYAAGDLPIGRLIWGMLLVIGLICVGLYVFKRLGGPRLLNRGRYMELMEVRPVGHKVQLLLVRVAGRVVLLGSAGENVTRLAEFAEDELPEPEAQPEHLGLEGFKFLLSKVAGASKWDPI